MEGYTEIVKIAEMGLEAKPGGVKSWMERFIEQFPKHELIKPFTALLKGDKNPDKLVLIDTAFNICDCENCMFYDVPPGNIECDNCNNFSEFKERVL